ncbi:hypothetical protein [Pseudomonas sp. UBA6699]|uniref:hypothetical protein n=1 Tax=Pseudomonas sp. UBA6699 TaxID=1947333 RepID=UPI00257A75EF|nr:hypothetical protein [Pseudomonas sp. UBA6699]
MKTFSVDHTQLSPNQRRMLDQQRLVRSMLNPVLADQVAQTIAALEVRKEQGAQPEKQWVTVSDTRGTISIAEWMGF